MRNIVIVVIIIAAIIMMNIAPAVADESDPYIVIDDKDNKVKFNKLSVGDPWHIVMTDPSTGNVLYDFSGTIETYGNTNPNVFIWFSDISPGGISNGVQKCIVQGSYSVHVEVTHGESTYEEDGSITIEGASTCEPPIIPSPELSTYILTSVGLIGLFGLARLKRK